MIATTFVVLLLLPVGIAAQPGRAPSDLADEAEIRQLMQKTWERPDAPLSVDPVVIVSAYAIAGWVQDDRGGRALLRKVDGRWDVVLCAGDHLRSASTISAVGASAETASRLVDALAAAEARLPRERLRQQSLFEGIERMDAQSPDHHK
jgi:hypothetical protein